MTRTTPSAATSPATTSLVSRSRGRDRRREDGRRDGRWTRRRRRRRDPRRPPRAQPPRLARSEAVGLRRSAGAPAATRGPRGRPAGPSARRCRAMTAATLPDRAGSRAKQLAEGSAWHARRPGGGAQVPVVLRGGAAARARASCTSRARGGRDGGRDRRRSASMPRRARRSPSAARQSTLRSSRTLPGQSCAASRASAAGVSVRGPTSGAS